MTALTPERIAVRQLILPALAVAAVATFVLGAVAFDQGALAGAVTDALRDRGGVLHELFHDGRHMLGVPCH